MKLLSKRYDIHRTTVMRHLDAAGIETRYRSADLDETTTRRVCQMYEAGDSIARIASALDLTPYVVGRELRRAGIAIRPRGFQFT